MFYNPTLENLKLDTTESQHCARVLRKQVGDTITIFDGKGMVIEAQLTQVGKSCTYEIKNTKNYKKPILESIIAVAPPKKAARFDFLIEKLVELGVNQIYLLETKNTERSRINEERLEKQVITACKQSKQYHLPAVHCGITIADLLKLDKTLFVCHCEEGNQKQTLQDQRNQVGNNMIWCIGPEGDFTVQEIKMLSDKGATMIDLGAMRLRTETAAIHIASWLKLQMG